MELFSINGNDRAILESPMLAQMKEAERLKSLDRHHYLIHLIIQHSTSKNEEEGFVKLINIDSITLKRYLGRKYSNIVDNLISLRIIQKNDKYSTGRFSMSYRLHPSLHTRELCYYQLQSNWFIKKIKEELKKDYKKAKSNPLLNKILVNTANLYLVDDSNKFLPERDSITVDKIRFGTTNKHIHFVESVPNQTRLMRYELFRRGLLNLNSNTDPEQLFYENAFYKPSISDYGRVYHFVASIPRKVRKGLRTKKGELLYEVDMSSAQPSLLTLEWLKHLKVQVDVSDIIIREANLLYSKFINGEIYEYVMNSSSYFGSKHRAEVKEELLKTLNAKYVPSKANIELANLFPSFMSWINELKRKNGNKVIAKIGQSAEAKIFVNTYKELDDNIFALIIHDCIITTKENLDSIRKRLVKRTKYLYKGIINDDNNLDNVFKTELVSLKDEELSDLSYYKYIAEDSEVKDSFLLDIYDEYQTLKEIDES